MYMLVSIASALVSVYACMLGCMYVCELGGSFAGGCPSLATGKWDRRNLCLIVGLGHVIFRHHKLYIVEIMPSLLLEMYY